MRRENSLLLTGATAILRLSHVLQLQALRHKRKKIIAAQLRCKIYAHFHRRISSDVYVNKRPEMADFSTGKTYSASSGAKNVFRSFFASSHGM